MINILVGKNGSGKTNFLDAINFLSLTKSAFSSTDQSAISIGEKSFSIKGCFSVSNRQTEVFCSVQAGAKKVLREGANEYQKLSDHIGKFPVVMIAPDDTELVKEGSEERRKFFDSIISQLDRGYLETLIRYMYALRQRNSLLKMFAETNSFDAIALESYNNVLMECGALIFKKRLQFIEQFSPYFRKFYRFIAENEPAEIEYESDLKETDFKDGLAESQSKDLLLQRTSFGIHRDDYFFSLNDSDLKKMGSQGQQKSFIISLKLAQFDLIKEIKKTRPILLLDDIFDKLDDFRIARLLELINNSELGQLFITDARPDRTVALLEQINVTARVFKAGNGTITPS